MRFNGFALVPGIAHGPLWAPPTPSARDAVEGGGFADFRRVRERLLAEAQTMPADLGEMYAALVLDPMWDDAVAECLRAGAAVAPAIETAAQELAAQLERLDDPYLRARAQDFEQVGAHLVRLLGAGVRPPQGAILCARNVSAIELLQWSPQLAGVVLFDVAPTAHITIVARGVGLPTILLVAAHEMYAATLRTADDISEIAVLDGFAGWLETIADAACLEAHPAQRIVAEPDPSPVIVGRRTLGVFANINGPDDAPQAAMLGADGVGLLRTEFLYTGKPLAPSLDEERSAYARVAAAFENRPIIVRTLDLGGDKLSAGLVEDGLDHGMLGIRGLRLTLRRPELFVRHLRAVLEAFAASDVRIMFPMVTFSDEFARARDYVAAASQQAGLARSPPLGIMLEVPAAAYAMREFAREGASFISIGTNDLAQYFFASSRLALGDAIDPARSAAFRDFLRVAIANAKDAGLEVGVCGEAASSAELSEFWIACGVDELSVAPGLVPWVKQRLRASSQLLEHLAFTKERP